jgi:carbamoyl-phosphate synthase large subunit
METGMTGLNTPLSVKRLGEGDDLNVLRAALAKTGADRLSVAAEALRMNVSVREIYDITGFDPWFLERFRVLLEIEDEIAQNGLPQNKDGWVYVKSYGFGDARLAELAGVSADEVMRLRHACGARPVFKRVDTCAAEFDTQTSYLYSTYETAAEGAEPECESRPTDRKKILIIGSGPNRIGQGIEFDYSCCHAAFALKERNIETIMVNCNPETVSTDYDTADRLYFEPLTLENILEIVHKEQQNGEFLGVIVQLGGQTPLKLSAQLQKYGVPILGTSPENIDLAEDRERFKEVLNCLNLKQPENGIARTEAEAMAVAKRIGFPAVVRPSYVLGGRAMEIVRNVEQLERYIKEAVTVSGESPVLIDKYLPNAIETDVDAICDGEEV